MGKARELSKLRHTTIAFVRAVAAVIEEITATGNISTFILVVTVKRVSNTVGHHYNNNSRQQQPNYTLK